MSRNFELMRQAGKQIGGRKPGQIAIRADETSATQLGTGTPVFEENKTSDWLRAVGILQKHWKLSAFFFAVVMVTTILVTVLTKPVYEATAQGRG